jgi:signal transduction histidine kinase
VVNYRDVSERRRAEQEQAQLQAVAQNAAREWRLTFDAVEFPILLLELDGTIARLNRAAMLLANREYRELKGCAVVSIGSGEPWRQISELVASVQVSRTSAFKQTHDQPTGKNWEITASLFSGSEAGDEKIIALARDVSPMVELQESLRRSETMSAMGQLVAGVAHEVRNPLFGISATLDAFSARFGEPEEYRQYTTILRREVGRLSALMRELLEYGKPLNQELAPGSLQPVITQAVLDCKLQADRAGVSINNNVGNVKLPVLMDRGRLLQVFRNLIENAIQHSPSGAAVSVDARQMKEGSESWIECAIADSGTGFQTEDLPRVFDPFFTKRRGGTGLGLSIVQRIVEEHKGSIRLGNRNGSGALVRVRLPLFNGASGNPNV